MVRFDYYDKLLVAIASSLALGIAIGFATSIPFESGLAGGAVIATVFVYEAMFRNPPLPTTHTRAAAVVWHAFLVVTITATVV